MLTFISPIQHLKVGSVEFNNAVADNEIVLPLAPQTVKRSAADDVNLANVRHPGVKRNKHRGKYKRKKLNGTTMPLLDDQLVST